jgi:serine/threonine protein phosphatase PrpC
MVAQIHSGANDPMDYVCTLPDEILNPLSKVIKKHPTPRSAIVQCRSDQDRKTVFTSKAFNLCLVADGHRTDEYANFLSSTKNEKSIFKQIEKTILQPPLSGIWQCFGRQYSPISDEEINTSIKSSCEIAETHIKESSDQYGEGGSTLSALLDAKNNPNIFVWNVGSSPIYVIKRNGDVLINVPHSKDNNDERERLKKIGVDYSENMNAFYFPPIKEYLQLSRNFSPWVNSVPSMEPLPNVSQFPKNDILAVVMGTDGACDDWIYAPQNNDATGFITDFSQSLINNPEVLKSDKNLKKLLQSKTWEDTQADDRTLIVYPVH